MPRADPVAWIDPQDLLQAQWVGDRLSYVLGKLWHLGGSQKDIRQAVSEWHGGEQSRLREVRKWKKAWRQRLRRASKKRPMKQVNVSLEEELVADLKKLAKHRRTTNTEAVRQLIVDAASQMRNEKAEERAQRKASRNREEKLREQVNGMRVSYARAIEELYRELDKLLPAACVAELVASVDGDIEGIDEIAVLDLVEAKVRRIRSKLVRIGLARFPEYEGPFAKSRTGPSSDTVVSQSLPTEATKSFGKDSELGDRLGDQGQD